MIATCHSGRAINLPYTCIGDEFVMDATCPQGKEYEWKTYLRTPCLSPLDTRKPRSGRIILLAACPWEVSASSNKLTQEAYRNLSQLQKETEGGNKFTKHFTQFNYPGSGCTLRGGVMKIRVAIKREYGTTYDVRHDSNGKLYFEKPGHSRKGLPLLRSNFIPPSDADENGYTLEDFFDGK